MHVTFTVYSFERSHVPLLGIFAGIQVIYNLAIMAIWLAKEHVS
jgi:hypothetical protein